MKKDKNSNQYVRNPVPDKEQKKNKDDDNNVGSTAQLEQIDAVYQTEQRQVGEHMDIYRGLSQLKEVERTCITLFFMEDLPIEKIAVITGMPAGTIKSHLSRGKTKLTTFLKQNGYDGKR